ncbi:MAG TPA: AsmA-like C-terminal region-containing protein, partial [Candidatus Binataceae bacterium]|nr:AsmA-like C-terminal region-containing protein [Candidatus Binataceae bacterium]
EIAQAECTLGDLNANAHNVTFSDRKLRAHIDTNRFDIGAMAKIFPTLQTYNASGHAEIHFDLHVAEKQPQANGTISLAGVSLSRANDKNTLIDNLNGEVHLVSTGLDAGPLKFDLGGGHATATFHVNSMQPLNASYNLSIDTIKVANFAPDRPDDELLNNVVMIGTVEQGSELSINTKMAASDGTLAHIVFKGFDLSATKIGNQLEVQSLKLGAFNGDILASGKATLGDNPEFALNLTTSNVDIQSALESQHAKAAGMIRGILDAQLQISGRGAKLDVIKPTLAGNGRATVHEGKLIGVNLAKDALKKVNGIPGIGDLVPAALVQKHPELFDSPDTDINSASLTFALTGPRITTHDLIVQTPDYWMTGDGWFDMEKNIEMGAHMLLTRGFTKEFIAERKNVAYLTNNAGQVDIPFVVRGALPKPLVVPDVAELAQRVGSRLLDRNARAIGKFLDKKNLPFINGGGNGGGSSSGNGSAKPSNNPIDQLKGLLH